MSNDQPHDHLPRDTCLIFRWVPFQALRSGDFRVRAAGTLNYQVWWAQTPMAPTQQNLDT